MEHKLFHIVAASGDAMVIGDQNKLPWDKYPEDLKFFKTTTMGTTVIMGRKTFESIGRALPNRENIVLSHSNFEVPDGVKLSHSLDEAIKSATHENIFFIGGADLYQQTIEKVDGIYLTKIDKPYPGDIKYPQIPSYFRKDEEKTRELQDKYKINIVYLENTGTS